ncbi:hypothetical protein BH10BAC3_BH10BAC3_15110 [soil metagenome]
MTFNQLIFSDQKAHRISRHLLFWTVCSVDFFIQNLNPLAAGDLSHWHIYKYALISLCSYLPIAIFSVYTGIYFLVPRLFRNKKYGRFIIGLLLIFAIDLLLNYYVTGINLKLISFDVRFTTFLHKLDFAYLYLIWIVIATVIAIGIKITKRWHLQQKENLEINRRKTRMEVQLQKTNIQPFFLFQTLDSITKEIKFNNNKAAGMVLGLADILSYSLYDSDFELVPLDMELSFLKEFIKLQHQHDEQKVITIQTGAGVHETYITPLILLSLLQECIAAEGTREAHSDKIHIQVNLADDKLAIAFFITYFNDLKEHKMLYIQKACSKLKLLYASAEYQVLISHDKSSLTVRLNVPLITDPYTENDTYSYPLNNLEHEPA